MKCCGQGGWPKSDNKVLLKIIILFFLIWGVLELCGCASIEGGYEFNKKRPTTVYRHPRTGAVLENVKMFYNWGVPDNEFGDYVRRKVEGTNYDEIVFRTGRNIICRDVVKVAVVYYFRK